MSCFRDSLSKLFNKAALWVSSFLSRYSSKQIFDQRNKRLRNLFSGRTSWLHFAFSSFAIIAFTCTSAFSMMQLPSAAPSTMSQTGAPKFLDPADYIELGNDHFLQKNREEALEDYDEAIRLNPNDHVPYYNRCFVKLSLGRQQEALEDCNKAISLKNSFSYALFVRGKIHLDRKEWRAAMDDLSEAAELFRAAKNPDLAEDALNFYRYALCPLCYQ